MCKEDEPVTEITEQMLLGAYADMMNLNDFQKGLLESIGEHLDDRSVVLRKPTLRFEKQRHQGMTKNIQQAAAGISALIKLYPDLSVEFVDVDDYMKTEE